MSGETPTPAPKSPYSWLILALGFSGLLFAAAICAFFIAQFLSIRPVSLRAQTQSLADTFEQVLLDNRVPPEQIHREPGGLVSTADAVWCFYPFEVAVPSMFDLDGFEELIRRVMLRHGVTLSSEPVGPDQRDLSLFLANHRFVQARLTVAPAPPAPRPVLSAPPSDAAEGPAPISAEPTPAPTAPESPAAPSTAQDAPPQVQLPTLAQAIRELDLDAILSIKLPEPEELDPESYVPDKVEPAPKVEPAAPTPVADKRVAIIVDDGGYGGAVTETILGLDPGLTLALLPNTPHVADTGKRALELGFQIMLHMPMARCDFPGRLSEDMTQRQMKQLFDNAFAQVPGAVGVNNHAGSQFTADEKAMERFLEIVKPTHLFFVDSRTTPDSTAYHVAEEMGLRAAGRDVFLDHESAPEYIRKQFDQLIARAEQKGEALAICHFRPATASVLVEVLPKLKEKNIKLVHASELVR